MDSVNKTLYIPLYGKAYVSRKGILLHDPKAEAIWTAAGFPLKGKSRSKWLAYYMGMRSAVFDRWLLDALASEPDAVVLHLGCGMDSRCCRVGRQSQLWFDVDFPGVIAERQRYFAESETYHMIPADIRDASWLSRIPADRPVLIVMEGVSMYVNRQELLSFLSLWKSRFPQLRILMDCYTEFAARASKYKNPVNEVGVTTVHGLDDPADLTQGTSLTFVAEHCMTPENMICQLPALEQGIFRHVFAGRLARKLYRLYEYR